MGGFSHLCFCIASVGIRVLLRSLIVMPPKRYSSAYKTTMEVVYECDVATQFHFRTIYLRSLIKNIKMRSYLICIYNSSDVEEEDEWFESNPIFYSSNIKKEVDNFKFIERNSTMVT